MCADTGKPVSAVIQENPADPPQEWTRRLDAVLNDPPITPEDVAALERRLKRPSIVINSMWLSCEMAIQSLRENLGHRNPRISRKARYEALRLMDRLKGLLLEHPEAETQPITGLSERRARSRRDA